MLLVVSLIVKYARKVPQVGIYLVSDKYNERNRVIVKNEGI